MKRFWALLLAVLLASSASAIILDATTKSLELETTTAASTDYYVSFADHTTTAFTPGDSEGNIASATTTTIVAAPAASTQRQVRYATVTNRSTTTAQTVIFKVDVSGTERHISGALSLAPRESARLNENGDVMVYTAAGLVRSVPALSTGYNGTAYGYVKNGTAKDAAGYAVSNGAAAGYPGAYTLGTPGVNGTATDCSVATSGADPRGAAEAGAHLIQDPVTGALYLTQAGFATSTPEVIALDDVLWWNTGLAVTTGAQAITQGTLAARDLDGTTNGRGVQVALLVTSTLGNAGVISNSTISYTDQDGNAGNTGTFVATVGLQLPATALIGTWVPFTLAAGDTGVRSIQSFNSGTTYTSGTFSLVMFRPLIAIPQPVASNGAVMDPLGSGAGPGIKIWPNTCIWTRSQGSAATATLNQGVYTIQER